MHCLDHCLANPRKSWLVSGGGQPGPGRDADAVHIPMPPYFNLPVSCPKNYNSSTLPQAGKMLKPHALVPI
jgi:hypothetical protein